MCPLRHLIWSEWWGGMTWPTKRQWEKQIQLQRQWKIYSENTLNERSWRLVTLQRNTSFENLLHFWQLRTTALSFIVTLQLRATVDSIRNTCNFKWINLGYFFCEQGILFWWKLSIKRHLGLENGKGNKQWIPVWWKFSIRRHLGLENGNEQGILLWWKWKSTMDTRLMEIEHYKIL